jgi:tripartite-type tricarboxylate transporter receptor subunit TctC
MKNNKRSMGTKAIALLAGVLTVAACSTAAPGGDAGSFPHKNIELFLGYDTGGSGDPLVREYARLMGKELKTGVTVQNRPGASGAVAVTEVLAAHPDGYTIAVAPASQLTVTPIISSDAVSYSKPDDWTTIGGILVQQNGLMVRPVSGWRTLADFIAAAKERPGQLRVGVSSVTGANAMAMASLMEVAGINLRLVPYDGGAGEATAALLGGHIDAVCNTLSGQLGLLQSGDLISLGHSGELPYTAAASKTFAEQGFPISGLAETTYYAYGPKGIPEGVLTKLAQT